MSIVYTPKPTTAIEEAARVAWRISNIAGEPCELHFNEKVITVDSDDTVRSVFEKHDRLEAAKGGTA